MSTSASLRRTYIVECYVPGIKRSEVEREVDRVRAASAELREEGLKLEYAGAILVPGDEVVFHILASSSCSSRSWRCSRRSLQWLPARRRRSPLGAPFRVHRRRSTASARSPCSRRPGSVSSAGGRARCPRGHRVAHIRGRAPGEVSRGGLSRREFQHPRVLKRVRVTYVVTALDDADGALPVTCRPRSGSWFTIGRTRVRCSATDTSGNESAIIFVVVVKRTR